MHRQQRGAGLFGWLIVLILIGFTGLMAIRIIPVYVEALTVRDILRDLNSDRRIDVKNKAQIFDAFYKRLDVNNISDQLIKRENFTIDTSGEGAEVTLEYEARFPLMGNLDGVANFKHKATLRN